MSVLQTWVEQLPPKMQTTLFGALRGPDVGGKDDPQKILPRWYRRCILVTVEGQVLWSPTAPGGGNYMAPIFDLQPIIDTVIYDIDRLPVHYVVHLLEGAEILGYKHPDPDVRAWWFDVYKRLAKHLILYVETEAQLDERLADYSFEPFGSRIAELLATKA